MKSFSKGLYDPETERGNRKLTAGDILAKRLVNEYRGLKDGITPNHIITAFNKASPAMALSKNAVRIINYLWSLLTPQIDFLPGQYAIVWPSNHTIMISTGISDEKSLKRAFREIRAEGLIAYKDAPNKQRRGRRDPESKKIILEQTYGIILTPMAGLYDKMLKRAEQYLTLQKYKREVRLNFNAAKREAEELLTLASEILPEGLFIEENRKISALLTQYSETGRDFRAKEGAIDALRALLSDLQGLIEDYAPQSPDQSSHAHSEADLEHMKSYLNKKTPMRGQNAPKIIPFTRPHSKIRNRLSDMSVGENQGSHPDKDSFDAKADQIRQADLDSAKTDTTYEPGRPTLDQVKAALPLFLRQSIRDDHGFYQIYDLIAEHAQDFGIDKLLLAQARAAMGLETTCACAAVIFEKHKTLNRPDNYLRSLITKHKTKNLWISRSLFGVIDRRAKGKANDQFGLQLQ
ncbi:MAG: replication initiation protein RepC [Maricaulaceae bacterium]